MIDAEDFARIAQAALESVGSIYHASFEAGADDLLVRTASRYYDQLAAIVGESTEDVPGNLYTLAAIILGEAVTDRRRILAMKPKDLSEVPAVRLRIHTTDIEAAIAQCCPFYGVECKRHRTTKVPLT